MNNYDLQHEPNFAVFFKTNYPQLCVYCKIKYNFDIHLAEDIVNVAFAKLWEVRLSMDPGGSPIAYLYKIVNNQCLNTIKHLQVQQRYSLSQLDTPSFTPPNSPDLKLLRAAIDAAIASLPGQMRQIFVLHRQDGLTYSEIATRLSISIKTVETQMSRALVKLRKKISPLL